MKTLFHENKKPPFGENKICDDEKNIHAKYFFSADKRSNKEILVPVAAQAENLTIAKWNKDSIKAKNTLTMYNESRNR